MSTARRVDSVLGKNTTNYKAEYDPGILAVEPRSINRTPIGISNNELPFEGFDTWHAYETTFLTANGYPLTGITKLVIPITSEFLVESKSLKLYLFSFSNMRLGTGSFMSAVKEYEDTVTKDLEKLLGVDVELAFQFQESDPEYDLDDLVTRGDRFIPLELLVSMEEEVDLEETSFTVFQESPALLAPGKHKKFSIVSDVLRSNCKITNQPDYGSVYITYEGENGVELLSLLKYLVSFRNEAHFHEEIVETIFTRINTAFKPTRLMVTALYTRRGGIDICPSRSLHAEELPYSLGDIAQADVKDWRQ